MVRWILVSAVLCLLAVSPAWAASAENCTACHRTSLKGVHAELACSACHGEAATTLARPSAAITRASGCVGCHPGYDALFDQAMSARAAEKAFVDQSYGRADPHFFENNCNACHVSDCLDCHGGDGHDIAPATQEACLRCHKGYFTGSEYLGRAPREDHKRYQRGKSIRGEKYLKMLPDLHAEIGLGCPDCHSMQSLVAGRPAAKQCRDCHQPSERVIEHRISAHLDKLECYACHSAWAPQEYGTFYLRLGADNPAAKKFRLRKQKGSEYLKSAYLKQQNAPPLGLNASGRLSPIRPQFIAYFSDLRNDPPVGAENRLLTAQWKAFFPHTIRSGTVMCDGCHNDARRFLLEKAEDRIYRVDLDGLGLSSFWNRAGQQVVNGAFLEPARFEAMSARSADYTRAYVEKWKSLVDRVEDSSKD